LRQAVANEQANAKAAEKLSIDLLLWYVGARLPITTGEGAAVGAADAALTGFSAVEKGIVIEVRGMLKAPEIAKIRQAYALGREIIVKVGTRTIQYEPGLNASGMTLLHETYRLTTSAIGRGADATAVTVRTETETEAAFAFAERAYEAVLAGL